MGKGASRANRPPTVAQPMRATPASEIAGKPLHEMTAKQFHEATVRAVMRDFGVSRKEAEEQPGSVGSYEEFVRRLRDHLRNGGAGISLTTYKSLTPGDQRAILHDYQDRHAHIVDYIAKQHQKAANAANRPGERVMGSTTRRAKTTAAKTKGAPAAAPATREWTGWTGHPMEHPIYKAIAAAHQPIVVQGKGGEPLTMVPHHTTSPDLVAFSLHRADGTEVAPRTQMGRWDFEQLAQRLIPAAEGAPRYTPPKPKAMSTLDRARFATSWSKAQAQAVATYVKAQMPYLGPVRVEETGTARGKTKHYLLVAEDREKGVTLRAHTWRDLTQHDEIRNVIPASPFRSVTPTQAPARPSRRTQATTPDAISRQLVRLGGQYERADQARNHAEMVRIDKQMQALMKKLPEDYVPAMAIVRGRNVIRKARGQELINL